MRNKLGASVAVALLLAASACGGGRPSESDLSKSMVKGFNVDGSGDVKLPKKTADCFAKILEKSGASDEFLTAIADNDKKYKVSKKDEKVLTGLNDEAAKCLKPAS